MQTESGGLKIGGGSLRLLAGRGDSPANPAPQVNLVGKVERQREGASGAGTGGGRKVGLIGRIAQGLNVRADSNSWKFRRPVKANHGARLTETRFGHLQILVGDRDLLLQGIQLRVTEHLPPIAAQCSRVGMRPLPVVGLFVRIGRRLLKRGRHRNWGLLVFRANHAAGEQ